MSRGKKLPPRIERVQALEGNRLSLRWIGGQQATVDLSGDLARYKSLAPLRKAAVFRQVALGEGGHSVVWPSGVDIGADSLWRDSLIALGHVDAVTFNDWRMEHGLTLDKAAEALGLSRRMVAYYSSGAKPVPKTVLLACRGWEAAHAA
ncbi:MAG: DUF2442 domain-containing protein [Steroidobacteraceae bacterium]